MLRNRHLQVKVMKDGELPLELAGSTTIVFSKPQMEEVVASIVTVVVAIKIVDTLCKIAIIKAGK